jgi:hypothetical protein
METHEIHLELRLDGAAPTGRARLAGGEPRPFSGWIGLVCTVETLITAEREPASPTARSAA